VPSKSQRCEQQDVDASWHNQEAPGYVIDDNNQRIDAGRWVKRAGQMHCDHCQTNSDGGGPRRWAAQFHNQQSNERGDKMTADKGVRLRRFCFGEPNTVTIDVANGIAKSGNALSMENASMLPMAIAPPAAPARMASS
jgi:hypothetical protein